MAGPPDSEDPFDGNRDDPVFMDTNEGASNTQDSDQNSSKYHKIQYRYLRVKINIYIYINENQFPAMKI